MYVTAAVVGDGDVVSVSVHDSGIGIPQARLDDIFAPFAQVWSSGCALRVEGVATGLWGLCCVVGVTHVLGVWALDDCP